MMYIMGRDRAYDGEMEVVYITVEWIGHITVEWMGHITVEWIGHITVEWR
jgi:hypothetical protein